MVVEWKVVPESYFLWELVFPFNNRIQTACSAIGKKCDPGHKLKVFWHGFGGFSVLQDSLP